jgi:hypothetical protein
MRDPWIASGLLVSGLVPLFVSFLTLKDFGPNGCAPLRVSARVK